MDPCGYRDSFARRPHISDLESSNSEGGLVDSDVQATERATTENVPITESPRTTENPPSGTSFAGNSPIEGNRVVGSIKISAEQRTDQIRLRENRILLLAEK